MSLRIAGDTAREVDQAARKGAHGVLRVHFEVVDAPAVADDGPDNLLLHRVSYANDGMLSGEEDEGVA